MGLGKYTFYLGGAVSKPPTNWRGLEVSATFLSTDEGTGVRVSETLQANIDIDAFTFVNEEAQKIINYRKSGLTGGNGVFEGYPFRIDVSDGTTTKTLLDAFIDFKNSYREVSSVEVSCKIKQIDNINSFDDRVRVNSLEYLESLGVFGQSDYINIPYIVERIDNGPELAMLQMTLVMYTIQGAQLVKEIFKDIANIAAHTAGGITGPISGIGYAIAVLALDIAFLAVLIIQMFKLLIEMIKLLAPPVQFHKGTYLFTLLEKSFDFLGYKFETGIEELSKIAYLPKKGSGVSSISSGVPKIGESGSSVSDLIGIVLKLFTAKIAIIDDTVHIRWKDDTFWIKNSPLVLVDVGNSDANAQNLESEEVVLNTNDFNANTFSGFSSDGSDQWTLEDDEGIDVQIIREPIVFTDEKKLLFNGLEDTLIPCALASRKDSLSGPEKILEALQSALKPVLDQAYAIYGNQINAILGQSGTQIPAQGNTIFNYLNTTSRIGAMKISSKTYSVPKLVLLEETKDGLKIPENHRKVLGARALYEKYGIANSFSSANNFKMQRQLFTERDIPFAYSDFLKINNNSYFTTFDGKSGKFESVKWKLDADKATVDYWLEKAYTDNIKETIIESP